MKKIISIIIVLLSLTATAQVIVPTSVVTDSISKNLNIPLTTTNLKVVFFNKADYSKVDSVTVANSIYGFNIPKPASLSTGEYIANVYSADGGGSEPEPEVNYYDNPDAVSSLDLDAITNWVVPSGLTVTSIASDLTDDNYAVNVLNDANSGTKDLIVNISDDIELGNYTVVIWYKIISGYSISFGVTSTYGWDGFHAASVTLTPVNEWRSTSFTGDIVNVSGSNPRIKFSVGAPNAQFQIGKIIMTKNE